MDICHEKKIKVVLDAVFNHCGYMFDKFQDVVEKGKDSPYYDWFYIKQWPIDFDEITYQTFGFEPKMPKLNTANPEVIDYLIKVGHTGLNMPILMAGDWMWPMKLTTHLANI